MLHVCRAGQRQHPYLHGESENNLGDTGPEPCSNGPNGWIDKHLTIRGQQRKSLIHDMISATEFPHVFIPSEGGIAPVLHDHRFMFCLCTELGKLFSRDIADPDDLSLTGFIERLDRLPHLPILLSQSLS